MERVVIVHGGELAQDVAEKISTKISALGTAVTLRKADDKPKKLVVDYENEKTLVCFVMQTIENEAPTEDGGACVRFFKRKTHPEGEFVKFSFAVLGLGDSNLLLDRQTTTAKDCNQVAQQLDSRLAVLGGKQCYPLGMADERTGLQEVEPWVDGLLQHLKQQAES